MMRQKEVPPGMRIALNRSVPGGQCDHEDIIQKGQSDLPAYLRRNINGI